jgi:hypothetical protein
MNDLNIPRWLLERATVLQTLRDISDKATGILDYARWSGSRPGNLLLAGYSGIVDELIGHALSGFVRDVANGKDAQEAYSTASTLLRESIESWNARHNDIAHQRSAGHFGQSDLLYAFWRVLAAFQADTQEEARQCLNP